MLSKYSLKDLKKLVLISILLPLSFQNQIQAQSRLMESTDDSTSSYDIFWKNGSELEGNIPGKKHPSRITSNNKSADSEVFYPSINRDEKLDQNTIKADSSDWFPNPNPSRYLFTNSGFNLNKGSGYYQNTYLLLNAFNVGVTDYFSIGGGFELISTFSRDIPMIYFFTPKLAFPITEKLRVGAGALLARADEFSVGLTYGLVTYGNSDDNLTAGLGWGFIEGEFTTEPAMTFSGMKRVRKRLSLITENWLFFSETGRYDPLLSYGLRFFGESFATDFGLINNPEIREVFPIGIPYLGFTITF